MFLVTIIPLLIQAFSLLEVSLSVERGHLSSHHNFPSTFHSVWKINNFLCHDRVHKSGREQMNTHKKEVKMSFHQSIKKALFPPQDWPLYIM